MIYSDGTHVIADTLVELHAFAKSVGIKRCWFHYHPRHPHYDTTGKRKLLVEASPLVKFVSSKQIVRLSQKFEVYRKLEKQNDHSDS
jgi:hypothetical protein